MPKYYLTKRGFQLDCDKPLHRGWGGGQDGSFCPLRTF